MVKKQAIANSLKNEVRLGHDLRSFMTIMVTKLASDLCVPIINLMMFTGSEPIPVRVSEPCPHPRLNGRNLKTPWDRMAEPTPLRLVRQCLATIVLVR